MNILGQEIARDQLPTLSMRQLNPDHLYQSIQDHLSAKLGLAPIAPQQPVDTGMSQAMEVQNG